MAAQVPLDRIPPTTTAYVIATAILAGVTGYFIGQGSSLNLFKEKQGWPNGYDVKVHRDSSDEEDEAEADAESDEESEDEGNGEELAKFKDNVEEVKLVLVVRTDLGMTKGTLRLSHEERKRQDKVLFLYCFGFKANCRSLSRQNRRSSFPCDSRLLQILPHTCARQPDPAPMGEWWPGQDCAAD